jgi:Ca2+-binding RTX toxin-like protein
MSDIYGTMGDDILEGDASDQLIYGEAGNDVLDGKGGWDSLVGGSGSDTYVFGYGSGTDFVFNYDPESNQTTDRILLTPGVVPADVELSVVTVDHRGMTIPASLLLTLRSTGETLMVRENFESSMGPSQSTIDFIEFADGTVWNRSDIRQLSGYGPLTLTGTFGDDALYGGEDDEVIDGSAGNDVLAGNGGSDTYVFGQGSGHDTIQNYEMGGTASSDRILLKPDVTPSDVELRMVTMDINGNGIPPSLQLRLKSTGETATVIGHFDPMMLGEAAITTIEFADGTVWDQAEIESRLDLYTGTDGDDLIMGMDGNDVIDGGAGNDVLAGNGGSDTYVFGQGSGHDTIYNQEMEGMTSSDRILLKPGVSPSDVELRVVTTDINGNGIPPSLQLRLKSTGETATVFGHFDLMVIGEAAITSIEFADGTVWDHAAIERRLNLFEGTDGDDLIMAFEGNDVLDGGAGNDQVLGGLGSDTYLFGYGSGHDSIFNHEPEGMTSSDRILLKPGVTTADVELRMVTEDNYGNYIAPSLQLRLRSTGETATVVGHFDPLVWGEVAITTIEFADGTVWNQTEIERRTHLFEGTTGDDSLVATEGDDVLDGGAGNDQLMGGNGSDTYVFGYGSGHDLILDQEFPGATASDRILLKPGVTAADVELRVVTDDGNGNSLLPSLQLKLKSTGETVIVMGQFLVDPFGDLGITTIEFADGTVWDKAEIERRVHLFEGTAGDDQIVATDGNDVLDGGAGNDQLMGGTGSDTYVFGHGSGHDLIIDHELPGMASSDRILLKPGVTAADVELRVTTTDANGGSLAPSLQLKLKSTGETVTVMGHFAPDVHGELAITTIEFADGTVWDQAEIERRAHLFEGTAGDDQIVATDGNDVLDGGAGNDVLQGGLGDDTYVVDSADDQVIEAADAGTDTVQASVNHSLAANVENLTLTGQADLSGTGTGLDNVLTGNVGNNILAGLAGHDQLYGGAGDDLLLGGAGQDTLSGGSGTDVLLGGAGNDSYLFGRGDGADTVLDTGGSADVLQFLGGVTADQLWFRKTGLNLEISLIGTDDKVTVAGWYLGARVEEFKTADGQTLLDNHVQNLVQAMAAFAPPVAGQTTLPESYAATLTPVIAANWQ